MAASNSQKRTRALREELNPKRKSACIILKRKAKVSARIITVRRGRKMRYREQVVYSPGARMVGKPTPI